MGEVAKPGKLARSRLPNACVSACSGKTLGVLGGGGWGEKSPALTSPSPEPGDYLAIGDVDRQINVPEGARSDLPHQFVFPPDDKFGLGATAARHPEPRRWRRGPSPDTSGKRMEASGAVPPDRTEERGRQPKREALLALQGAESTVRNRLAEGQAAVREGWSRLLRLRQLLWGGRRCLAFAATLRAGKGAR